MTLHTSPPVIPFIDLSPADRRALLLHIQCEEEGYGREPCTVWDAERYVEALTADGYAKLFAEWKADRSPVARVTL